MQPLFVAVLLTVAAILLVANVVVSRRIIRDNLASSGQKTAQFLLVWLVPIAGAIFVGILTRNSAGSSLGSYGAPREEPDDDVAVAHIDYSSSD